MREEVAAAERAADVLVEADRRDLRARGLGHRDVRRVRRQHADPHTCCACRPGTRSPCCRGRTPGRSRVAIADDASSRCRSIDVRAGHVRDAVRDEPAVGRAARPVRRCVGRRPASTRSVPLPASPSRRRTAVAARADCRRGTASDRSRCRSRTSPSCSSRLTARQPGRHRGHVRRDVGRDARRARRRRRIGAAASRRAAARRARTTRRRCRTALA